MSVSSVRRRAENKDAIVELWKLLRLKGYFLNYTSEDAVHTSVDWITVFTNLMEFLPVASNIRHQYMVNGPGTKSLAHRLERCNFVHRLAVRPTWYVNFYCLRRTRIFLNLSTGDSFTSTSLWSGIRLIPGLAILPSPGFPTPEKPGLGNNALLAKVGNNGQ